MFLLWMCKNDKINFNLTCDWSRLKQSRILLKTSGLSWEQIDPPDQRSLLVPNLLCNHNEVSVSTFGGGMFRLGLIVHKWCGYGQSRTKETMYQESTLSTKISGPWSFGREHRFISIPCFASTSGSTAFVTPILSWLSFDCIKSGTTNCIKSGTTNCVEEPCHKWIEN